MNTWQQHPTEIVDKRTEGNITQNIPCKINTTVANWRNGRDCLSKTGNKQLRRKHGKFTNTDKVTRDIKDLSRHKDLKIASTTNNAIEKSFVKYRTQNIYSKVALLNNSATTVKKYMYGQEEPLIPDTNNTQKVFRNKKNICMTTLQGQHGGHTTE
jgi:hypothetical protein